MSSLPTTRGLSFFTQVGGRAMHGVELGEGSRGAGPTFVLVPGLGLSGRYMMPTAELLAASGRVWVPDLPGCGRSETPEEVLGISELGDALVEWMVANGIERPVLIGNSLGAQVIVDLAARYPDRVDRAVLVSLTMDPDAPWVVWQLGRLLVDALYEPPKMVWIAVVDYLRFGFLRGIRTLRDALADPVERKLQQIACPVLVIRGGQDPIVPERWAERSVALIADGELVVFPEAGHAVNYNSPDMLAREVMRFVAGERSQVCSVDL